jgi:hypothetical protein
VRRNIASTTIGQFALFGGGYFYNYSNSTPNYYATIDCYNSSLTRSAVTGLDVARSYSAATTVGNYALFGGGAATNSTNNVDVYSLENAFLQATVCKGSKYKFQNMTEEATVKSEVATITIPTPATGYIKIKKTKL